MLDVRSMDTINQTGMRDAHVPRKSHEKSIPGSHRDQGSTAIEEPVES